MLSKKGSNHLHELDVAFYEGKEQRGCTPCASKERKAGNQKKKKLASPFVASFFAAASSPSFAFCSTRPPRQQAGGQSRAGKINKRWNESWNENTEQHHISCPSFPSPVTEEGSTQNTSKAHTPNSPTGEETLGRETTCAKYHEPGFEKKKGHLKHAEMQGQDRSLKSTEHFRCDLSSA